ncbi:hypothetical protein [Streptomyces sp. NPDC048340]|uniref:hypothetical protein n=1 Tax=Streptomyces sp. NPDC048340 TaxID=3365537 RepID=UPI00371B5780
MHDKQVSYDAYREGLLVGFGIRDGIDCYNTLNIKTCAMAAVAFAPLPVGKAAGFFGKALRAGLLASDRGAVAFTWGSNPVEWLALSARSARPRAVWINPKNGDDAVKKLNSRHRSGGAENRLDPDAGVFEGKYVKGDNRLMAAIQKTIDEGKASPNTGGRPGVVYELDHRKDLGRMGVRHGNRTATGIRVVLDEVTGFVVTAHPI